MFVFGDSYSATGFQSSLAQPSKANPLGNPGYTSTNGPNWVGFLTTTYNATFHKTVDSAVIKPFSPTARTVKDQVQSEFLPVYASKPSSFPWQSSDTLFATFVDINDIGMASGESGKSALYSRDLAVYASLMDQVYQAGARNFLFLNVPPIDRSRSASAQDAAAQAATAADIAAWNSNVNKMTANLSSTYPDAYTHVFDTNALFTQVLNNPASYPETATYKITDRYCAAYENGTPTGYTLYSTCSVPVDEYFWLHPTFRAMQATAHAIAKELSS